MDESHRFVVAVTALIFRDGRVLAMRRSPEKDAAPGVWETPSGRLDPGEAPLDAVMREIEEECALEVRLDPRPITAYVARRLDDDMLLIVYRADHVSGEVVRSDEHDAHDWLTPEEFEKITPLKKLAEAVRSADRRDAP